MKKKLYLLSFLAILFSIILFSNQSVAKETTAKGVPQQLEELTKQLNDLSSTVAEQQKALTDMKTHHEKELANLNELINSQASKINQLEATVSTQQEKIKNLENFSKNQGENINSLQTQLQTISQALTDRLDELSNQFTSFKEQVEEQINRIFTDLDVLKKNPPVEDQNGYTVSGRMVDSNGISFRSGFTLVDQTGKRYGSRSIENDGSFVLNNIPNGTYHVKYYFRSYEVSPQEIVVNGGNVNNILIQLTVPTFTITGKAFASDGTPLQFEEIRLIQDGNIGGYWPSTSSDGSFVIAGVAPGNYTIVIGDSEDPAASMEMQVNGNLNDLVVKGLHAYKVTGHLVDSNGELFYTSLSLVDQNNKYYWVYQTDNGFSAPNLPNGVYKIRFGIEPYQSLLVTSDEIVVNGSNIENLEIRISQPTYYVSGTALDSNGNPIGNQRIHIYNPSTRGWGGDIKTRADGTFVVAGLPNGTYLLKIGDDHNNPIVQGQVTISNGNAVGVVIQGK